VRRKILLTGGSGLLALNWALYLRDNFDIYLGLHKRIIKLNGVNTCKLDLENECELENVLITIKPDILINTAGLTNVEECELNPKEAFKINSIIPGILAKLSNKLDIYFIHISTDHLFDGINSFITEQELTCPINVYGKSKALGELKVLENNSDSLIIRTNFFSWGTRYRKSFSDFIIDNVYLNRQIDLFSDVFFTPILTKTAFQCIDMLIEKRERGIFNIVSNEKISKYDFGILIGNQFKLDNNLINNTSIKSKLNLINRPHDMSLSNAKFSKLFDFEFPSLKDQIMLLNKQQYDKGFDELRNIK
jgi:dTDP-4-dehydrorhamnose reductase